MPPYFTDSKFVDLMSQFSMRKQKQQQIKAKEVYEECSPSVAKIDVSRRGTLGDRRFNGSAFVWDTDLRLLVTCHHVIHAADEISATFDDSTGKSYKAEVVFSDPNRDLALLRVDAPKNKLKPITAGNSDTVSVGDKVLVIGNPGKGGELKNTLTRGIISGLEREAYVPERQDQYNDELGQVVWEDRYKYPAYQIQGALQTDAAINPGNSGGPVIDESSGKVIGMASCVFSPGLGFAVTVNTIREFVNQPLTRHYSGIPNSDIGVCTMVSGSADLMDTRPNLRVDSPPVLSVEESGDITNSANEMCCDVWSHVIQVSLQATLSLLYL